MMDFEKAKAELEFLLEQRLTSESKHISQILEFGSNTNSHY